MTALQMSGNQLLGSLKKLGKFFSFLHLLLDQLHIIAQCLFYSKADPELLPKVMHNLQFLLSDSSVAVQKRVIQALTQLYKIMLQWLARANTISESMEKSWNMLCQMKALIAKMVDHDNDG